MASLKVLHPGLFTSIQDYGRVGFRKYGVPTSGAMDTKSYELANSLVGNPKGNAVLELTMMGGSYLFESDAIVAITGALMNSTLNGEEIANNSTLSIKKGDELKIGYSNRGCRCYLAIRGELNIEKLMNSYSTYSLGKFGGFKGRILKKGDELHWQEARSDIKAHELSKNEIPYFSSKVEVRIMKGLEWDWLSDAAQSQLISTKFEVSAQSNRMGIRLEKNSMPVPDKEMRSSAVVPGVIQLPPNGMPIILMQDGQTVGGYPRIAKVLNEDLWRVGQLKPGDLIGFKLS